MRLPNRLADLATFVVVAAAVYVAGAALLAAWPIWAVMGAGWGWLLFLALLAMGVVAGVVSLSGRARPGVDAGGADAAERCPQCRAPVQLDFVLCPECHTGLRPPCPSCGRPLKASWTHCPYCGAAAQGIPSMAAGVEQERRQEA